MKVPNIAKYDDAEEEEGFGCGKRIIFIICLHG